MTDWKAINVKKSLHKEIHSIAQKLNKPFGKTLEIIVKDYQKKRHYEAEIEKLKQQLEAFKRVNKETTAIAEKYLTFLERYPCLARFEDNAEFYCVNKRANAIQLKTLKICSGCQWRLTEETGKFLKRKYILTCGATEHIDKKKGLMVYCEKDFQGSWVTPEDCKTCKCLHVKEVQIA